MVYNGKKNNSKHIRYCQSSRRIIPFRLDCISSARHVWFCRCYY